MVDEGVVNGGTDHEDGEDWGVQVCPNKLKCSILDTEWLSKLPKVPSLICDRAGVQTQASQTLGLIFKL